MKECLSPLGRLAMNIIHLVLKHGGWTTTDGSFEMLGRVKGHPEVELVHKKRRKRCNSLRMARIEKFVLMRSSYFSILRGPCFTKLFHPSHPKRVTAFPPFLEDQFNLRVLFNPT